MDTITKRTTVTDTDGYVIGTKVEICEWTPPPKVVHSGLSKSAIALMAMKPGETKRIVHGELKCGPNTHKGKKVGRACSLQPTIYKLRKQGWGLEYYHEKDHVMVVRRLK